MVAVVSGVLLILSNTGIITVEHANYISDILNTFLTAFVGVGVFGNPDSHVPVNKEALVQAVLESLAQSAKPVIPPAQTPVIPVIPHVPVGHSTQLPSNTTISN
jgi:uncharacterized membrane protein